MTNKYDVISLLQTLIRSNTCQPEGNEADLVNVLLDLFSPYQEQVMFRVFEHSKQRKSLLLRLGPEKSGGLAFVGHLDTVAIGDKNKWNVEPHAAEIINGHVYGRGSADMKSGVSAMTVAALNCLFEEQNFNKPLYLVYTADEEKGSCGVEAVIESKLLSDVAGYVIPEPTDNKIAIAERGALWLRLKFHGKSAHGSQPQNGINAIEIAMNLGAELKKTFASEVEHILLGKGSASITQLKGGVLTNMIPDQAVLEMDIRTLPGREHKDLLDLTEEKIAALKHEYPGLGVELELIKNMPPIEVSSDSRFVSLVQTIVKQKNLQTDLVGMSYYTDAARLIPTYSKPFVILGPGHEAMAHQSNESVAIKRVEEALHIYQQLIVEFCS